MISQTWIWWDGKYFTVVYVTGDMVIMSAIVSFSKKCLSIIWSRSGSSKGEIAFKKQRANIKFCQRLEKSTTEILHLLQRCMVNWWYINMQCENVFMAREFAGRIQQQLRRTTYRGGSENIRADLRQISNIVVAKIGTSNGKKIGTSNGKLTSLRQPHRIVKNASRIFSIIVLALAEVDTCRREDLCTTRYQ